MTDNKHFAYKKGELFCEQVPLRQIAEEVGTPVYVYSATSFLENLEELQNGFQGLDAQICFAAKSNSNIAILNLLSEAGAGLDIVSAGELFRAHQAGFSLEKIIFSGVGKTREEMELALKAGRDGIFSFNVESIEEMDLLSSIGVSLGRKARVALRFNPDVNPKTHPHISTGLKKNKFGLNRDEVFKILNQRTRYPGVTIHGISVHIGSQILSLSPLKDAFQRVRELILEIQQKFNLALRFVDLGGGLGIPYHDQAGPSRKAYCDLIRKLFSKPPLNTLKILIEPGRTISGNSGVLLTQVLFRKKRKEKDFLVVDAGMNDLIRPALYDSYHEIVPLKKVAKDLMRKTALVGPVCESSDRFFESRPFPGKIKYGDYLAVLSAGAYGFSMSSNYNSRLRPAEVLVMDRKFSVIRARETFKDLIRGERLL